MQDFIISTLYLAALALAIWIVVRGLGRIK